MKRSIDRRLAIIVGSVLLIFSLISGSLTYLFGYQAELDKAARSQSQIVQTVLAQAEVAVFAQNEDIADGVLNGLLENPIILGCRITGTSGFELHRKRAGGHDKLLETTEYRLNSPFDKRTAIGALIVAKNLELIESDARTVALKQTLILLIEVFVAAGLLVFFTRRLISQPILRLTREIASVKPGSGKRISLPLEHHDDEIGHLINNTNSLIDAAENALDEVRALATLDYLTGLPNRRHFMEKLHDEFERIKRFHEPVTVLMLDLDHFKQVNDTYGHAAGDAVLAHFARLIRAELRIVDIPGRLGGEEFGILLPGTEPQEARSFAERLRRSVEFNPVKVDNHTIPVTTSIGIAGLQPQDNAPELALQRADEALYLAKNSGRNRIELSSTL